MYEGPMDMDNSMAIDCGSWGGWSRGKQWGKIGTTVMEQQ